MELKACSHTGCTKPHLARGYCSGHYGQFMRHGYTWELRGPGRPAHRCQWAGCEEHASPYCPAHRLLGLGQCDVPACEDAKHSKRNQFCDPHARRNRTLRHAYGIGILEYEAIRKAQDGKCAICQASRSLHLDHCHDTGAIRGMLCGPCNRGIGLFGHDPEVLRQAAAYLT